MNYFVLAIFGIGVITISRMFLTSKKEQEKLRIELGLPEDHPTNETIERYLFHNHFQLFMLLTMITIMGLLIKEVIMRYCNC